MRVVLVGTGPGAEALAAELATEDVAVTRWPEQREPRDASEEIAAIARSLREFEGALEDGGYDAVLAVSRSAASLAAVIVATKLRTPVAAIRLAEGEADGVDATLVHRLADADVAPEAASIAAWLRETYTERP